MQPLRRMTDDIFTAGYEHALSVLQQCSTKDGFTASPVNRHNYQRVWSRDGVIIGLAALLTDNEDLHQTFIQTLRTLKRHQGPHGEIPSNVDCKNKRVSYGGTAGRVDADLWYLIGCHAYWEHTKDEHFLDESIESIEQVLFLLGAWEYNGRGLLYVPHTGDWSDEYMQHGYILYDQLLYYRALHCCAELLEAYRGKPALDVCEKIGHVKNLIQENYWFDSCDDQNPDIYHPVLYKRGCEAAGQCGLHWLPYFSPAGYGYRFDAFANVLVSLLEIASSDQCQAVDDFIAQSIVQKEFMVLPAFHPIITPDDVDWNSIQISFSYTFKNKPYEYHNGGLWPMVTGFYVADLAKRGKTSLAKKYLHGIHQANRLGKNGREWDFSEFIHGKNHTPRGTRLQGWSAAAAVMGHHALQGQYIL